MLKSLLYVDPISVVNDGSQTIPGYGIVEFSGADSVYVEGKTVFKVQRPSSPYKRIYLVNGPTPIAQNDYGTCYYGCNTPIWALWDDEDTPEIGMRFGPKKDSFNLQNHFYGFEVVGQDESSPYKRVLVTQHFPDSLTVKLDVEDVLSWKKGCTAKVQRVIGDNASLTTEIVLEDSDFELPIFDIGYLTEGKELTNEAQCEVGVRGNLWAVFQSLCPTAVE